MDRKRAADALAAQQAEEDDRAREAQRQAAAKREAEEQARAKADRERDQREREERLRQEAERAAREAAEVCCVGVQLSSFCVLTPFFVFVVDCFHHQEAARAEAQAKSSMEVGVYSICCHFKSYGLCWYVVRLVVPQWLVEWACLHRFSGLPDHKALLVGPRKRRRLLLPLLLPLCRMQRRLAS